MTNERVTDFASELVQMATAMKRLPEVQAELDHTKAELDAAVARVQRLELRLMERAQKEAELQSNLRKVEAERDDAELRFLERDDALGAIRRALEGVVGSVRETLQATEPPVVVTPGQSAEGPTVPNADATNGVTSTLSAPVVMETQVIGDPLPDGATTSVTLTSETPSQGVGESVMDPTATSSPDASLPTVGEGASTNASGPGSSPTDVPTDPATDPEPSLWTQEWYDWKARRAQAAQ